MERLRPARSFALGLPAADGELRARPMSSFPALALDTEWWSILRDREPVRTALAFVLHEVWERRIDEAFEDNKRLGRGITNVSQLADFIRRNQSGLNRRVNSDDGDVTLGELFLFAWALRIPVRDLFPKEIEWIAGVVRRLVPDLSESEATAYAHYRWHAKAAYGQSLDEKALAQVVKVAQQLKLKSNAEADVAQAVLRTATALEPLVTPFAQWLHR